MSETTATKGQIPRWNVRYAIDRIVGAVAELPDRTSPDDWPDVMLVTADELRAIVSAEIDALLVPPAPWAWEWVAEKSNDWAVGQAFDANGQPIDGRLPEGEWLEDTIIERRLVGMNESGHARAADAEFIAAAPRLVRALLAKVREGEQDWTMQPLRSARNDDLGEAAEASHAQLAARVEELERALRQIVDRSRVCVADRDRPPLIAALELWGECKQIAVAALTSSTSAPEGQK